MVRFLFVMILTTYTASTFAQGSCYLERIIALEGIGIADDDERPLKLQKQVDSWQECYLKASLLAKYLIYSEDRSFNFGPELGEVDLKVYQGVYWVFDGDLYVLPDGGMTYYEGIVNYYTSGYDRDQASPGVQMKDVVGHPLMGPWSR